MGYGHRVFGLVVVVLSLSAGYAHAAPKFEDLFPQQEDPFVGNYVGRWSEQEEVNPDICAQIIALGGDEYRMVIVNKLNMRCPILLQVELKPKGGKLSFDEGGFNGTTDGQSFTGSRGKMTYSMQKTVTVSPTMGKEPPAGAVVLFGGTNLDAWTPESTEGWTVLDDGTLLVTPDGKYIVSKGQWKDCELHVEFRTPFMPKSRGQQRGNSGVFLQDAYEVQVLDTFGLEGYYDECGALYKLSAPHVNACLPPLHWQTYDISYTAPRFDESGKLTAYGRMTVYQNGVLIHHDQELTYRTEWKEVGRLQPPPTEAGPVKLQGHDNFVEYRNIWLVDKSGGN